MNALLDAAADQGGVSAGSDGLVGFFEDGLREDSHRGCAIPADFVHAPERMTHHHRPHVGGGMGDLNDAAGDDRCIVQQLRRAIADAALDADEARQWAKRGLHCVGH